MKVWGGLDGWKFDVGDVWWKEVLKGYCDVFASGKYVKCVNCH